MRKSPLLSALALVAAGALALSGCSTSGGTDTDSSSGGTLVLGQLQGVSQLDPNITSLQSDLIPTTLLYSALTKQAEDGSIVGDLADSWETSEDGLEWTFTLKSGVTFHDGSDFTAQDVVDSVEYVLNPDTASQYAAKISAVASVEAVDDLTVKFTLSVPSPALAAGLTYTKIVQADDLATINETGNGTGPFKLENFVPGQELDVVANPDYFGGAPKVEGVKVVKYADQTAAERALSAGEVSMLYDVPKANIDTLLGTADLQLIVPAEPGGLSAWEVDTTSAPFNNPAARQALSYAMDRESMVAAGYAGYATINTVNSLATPTSPYFASGLTEYEFDLDKAKALFAEAGVTEGTTLTFWSLAGAFPEWVTMAQILQADLAKIGITLDIQTNETNTWLEKFYPAGKTYPATIVPNQLSFAALPDTFSSQWFSKNGSCECNWTGTDEFNAAVDVVTTSYDEAERKAAFEVIQQIISDQVPIVIIANVSANAVATAGVSGAWIQGDNLLRIENASLTK
jgi:peptide/nickel transport system substrate-binding protein